MASTRIWAICVSVGALVVVTGIAAYNYVPEFSKQHEIGDTPAQILNRNGYLEIRPATNLGGPGTIVTVDLKTDSFVMLHPTCNMNWTEVSALWQSSPSVDTNIASELSGEFKIGADLLKRVGLNVSGDAINEIDMKLENTKVIVLTDESRFSLGAKYLKGDCLNAVLQINSVAKKCVTQPISAMQADVSYRIKFSNKIAANDKERILDGVSGALATDGRRDSSDSIIGKGLFVGLKLDAWCIVPNDGHAVGTSVAGLPATDASIAISPTSSR